MSTAMGDTKAVLLDTRKTIPGLRLLEKYADPHGRGYRTTAWGCGTRR